MAVETLIRGGSVVLPDTVLVADLAIDDQRIVAIGPDLADQARTTIDARGLHVLPGVIDSHVHFNAPGRDAWEGVATGTAALAAGGATCYFDMPLNASPPTLDRASLDLKMAATRGTATVDFGFWGGLVPRNLGALDELAERGVVGFKAFMSNSGIDDFAAADDYTLWRGMTIAARLGRPVAVHAENDRLTAGLAAEAIAAGRRSVRDYLHSRPVVAELEAIARAIGWAADTRCALHIVHVSCGRGVALVAEARARGVDVTCETCPHYLVFTEEDAERLGAVAKCAPPLRTAREQQELWQAVVDGDVAFLASDHSPAPESMKQTDDFFAVWGGIAGCQLMLRLLLTAGHDEHRLPLSTISSLLAGRVARRFSIARKGTIVIGHDADLVVVDLASTASLAHDDLRDRHRLSPYLGRTLRGQIRRTLVRGQTVYLDGHVVGRGHGQFVRPE